MKLKVVKLIQIQRSDLSVLDTKVKASLLQRNNWTMSKVTETKLLRVNIKDRVRSNVNKKNEKLKVCQIN